MPARDGQRTAGSRRASNGPDPGPPAVRRPDDFPGLSRPDRRPTLASTMPPLERTPRSARSSSACARPGSASSAARTASSSATRTLAPIRECPSLPSGGLSELLEPRRRGVSPLRAVQPAARRRPAAEPAVARSRRRVAAAAPPSRPSRRRQDRRLRQRRQARPDRAGRRRPWSARPRPSRRRYASRPRPRPRRASRPRPKVEPRPRPQPPRPSVQWPDRSVEWQVRPSRPRSTRLAGARRAGRPPIPVARRRPSRRPSCADASAAAGRRAWPGSPSSSSRCSASPG